MAFQLLYLGAPMIFYGDEAGLWGANDPDCRKPMLWADKTYDPETANPDQTTHPPDEVRFNADLFGWYQQLIRLRRESPAVRRGTFTTLTTDDARRLYAFSRQQGNDEVIVVLNRGARPAAYTHAALNGRKLEDAFTGKPLRQVIVPPMDVVVLRKQ